MSSWSRCWWLALAACSAGPQGAVEVRMDPLRSDGFYSAPFPSDGLRQADGRIALRGFPNPNQVPMLGAGLAMLAKDARGFARAGGVFFQLTGTLAADQLPSLEASTRPDAKVFLMALDGTRRRHPIEVTFRESATPSGAPRLLALLPLQGRPLQAGTRYAAVVLRALLGSDGQPLRASDTMRDLAAGRAPDGMPGAGTHLLALEELRQAGVAAADIAGFTVFTTDDPVGAFRRAVAEAGTLPAPGAFVRKELYDDYCLYQSSVSMPVFQEGTPPYSMSGGRWAFDADGHLSLQRQEVSQVYVSVPRQAAPVAGYPVALMLRTGSGTDRGLDRGAWDSSGRLLVPGDGPARHFARAGFAGLSFEGPHGGSRNVSRGDEQFLMFNVFNPPALRDNVRQAALETVLVARALEKMTFDAADCPGAASTVRLDVGTVALMGHSMGASIAPLATSVEPRLRALLMSGAGASWIANATDKLKPLDTRAALEVLLDYRDGMTLTRTDPTLTLVQWAAEPADAQVFAPHLVEEPLVGPARHVLMFQGVVDHYIMPRIANALTLSAGLDLAGAALDEASASLSGHTPLRQVLGFSGGAALPFPVKANRSGATAVVVQLGEDGVQDGHEVMFQLVSAQNQYAHFLRTLAQGTPEVVSP